MTLFDDASVVLAPEPAPRRRRRRRGRVGVWSLAVALVCLLALSFLPTGYVIEQPGPVYDTIGEVEDADGRTVPLLSIEGAQTYPTSGSLNLLTVQVVGSPESPTSWLQVLGAWFDPTRAVVPVSSVFPSGQTSEQRTEENAALMTDSQLDAEAAAFAFLGHDVSPTVQVASVADGGAAAGTLRAGDGILAVDGDPVATTDQLRAAVAAGEGAPLRLTLVRDGAQQEVSVAPTQSDGAWLLGITVQLSYDLPYEVRFALDGVGGPSAGMMFALGIVDELTPGELTGGKDVAGTGTITADGTVGAIGGIRQKMWGAVGAGADYFLAPQANCDEVAGHVPSGLRVFSVSTLEDAIAALDTVAQDGDLDALPTCTAG